jgi:hypothetical protein
MHLIELFLPLRDNRGQPFPHADYVAVERQLTERFGGVTAYPRAPATGLWKTSPTKTVEDDLVVYEVMADKLDVPWWQAYREALEKTFRQDRILIRAQQVDLL